MTNNKIIAVRRDPNSTRLFNPVDADIELTNGKTVTWSYIDGPDIAVVLAVQDGMAMLKSEWRLSQQREVLEVVSGRIDGDETPLQCAVHELKEEVGIVANRIELLGVIPLWNHANVRAHIFLATELTIGDNAPDETEILKIHKVPLQDIIGHVQRVGTNAQTLLALYMAKEKGVIT